MYVFKEFSFIFYDDKDHPKGVLVTLTALTYGQALIFADDIARNINWTGNVKYECLDKVR